MRAQGGDGLAGIELDRKAGAPVYRQLYRSIRDAILDGRLRPGARLPSARSLASLLGVARGTVDLAYGHLAAEGYVIGRGAAGTVVDPDLDLAALAAPPPPTGPIGTAPLVSMSLLPFQMGLPALDCFPRKAWARLATRAARVLSSGRLAYRPTAGEPGLRHEIARYLGIARGIACHADEILVTAGFQGALGLIARALLRPGDPVWLENPGWPLGRAALAMVGARLVGVPVDESGMVIEAGKALAPDARLALVTPSQQFPTGVALSLARRLALLDWAASAGSWIVEDDYDSEFRYSGRPLPPLGSLDRRGRVLYVGTFSKVLFPGLRLAYLVAPPDLAGRLHEVAELLQPGPPASVQDCVAAFMAEGHFARHIRRMRALYGERRGALAAALEAACGDRLSIVRRAGGMHLMTRLPEGADDEAVAARAEAAGLAVLPLSRCAVSHPAAPGLLLGFTNILPGAAPREAARLAAVLEAEERAAGRRRVPNL